ncbi:plasmid replication protein, CyRepA1 family [uncultured Nostoc sp.]|uniref:plasmid replication protein, CyRepA1 family n=1 Tax=uncultured Nostoc sp. TaxID=340711 RepID=UPI0035CC1045
MNTLEQNFDTRNFSDRVIPKSSGFTLFGRGQCPICNGASKGCRQSNTTGLIFCRYTAANPINYLYRGQDRNGFELWQSSADADDFASQSSEQRKQKQHEFLKLQDQNRKQQAKEQLSLIELDKWYRMLLSESILQQSDRQSLLNRGSTPEQIERHGYKSVSAWQKVKQHFPHNLPGILDNGVLNVHTSAIVAPVFNHDGLIVTLGVRLNESENGRYRTLTSATKRKPDGVTSHLDGELPITVIEPSKFLGNAIWLTEGVILKPNIASDRLSVPVIGAMGGRFGNSPKLTESSLTYLSDKYHTKLVIFALDAGDVANQSNVAQKWISQYDYISSLGYECQFAWWGQSNKNCNDIDELPIEEHQFIEFISYERFIALCHKYGGIKPEQKEFIGNYDDKVAEVQKQSLSYAAGESEFKHDSQDWAWRNWLKSRTYTPDIIVNQSKFRFPQIPDKDVIIDVKSGLGSSKTEALIEQVRLSTNRSFLIGYRNNLLLQTGNRASQVGLKIYHLQEDDGRAFVADNATHLALCLDSIHHIDGYFNGVDIYLDEAVSVLLHAVTGGTLKEEQGRAIAILSKALRECNRVFLLDGNLADIHVDFIAKIAGKKVIKIENQAKIPPHNFKFIIGIDEDGEIKQRDKSPLIKALLDNDVIPFIASDSKNLTDRLDEILRQSGKHGYVLNKDTSGEPWAKEFLVNPDAFIEKYKPDYFIISPTAESGVSVTIKNHFTDKFTFFTGVQGTSSQHQILFRLRDDSIPHYVFCPEKSTIRDRNNPKNYSVKAFSKLLDEKIILSAILAADGNTNSTMLEIIGNAIARSNDDWWQLSCQLGALDNFEMNNLRKCLIHALEEAGHSVEICEWDIDDEAKNKEKAAKEAVTMRYALELYKAIEFNSVEEASKVAKSNPTKEVQRRIEKTWLLDALPGITDLSLWDAEFIADYYLKDKEFISKQRRFYFLQNFEISKKRSEVNWYYMATNQNFFLSQAKNDSHLKIWALQELNILQFLDGEYHRNSPALVSLVRTVRERNDIASALNIMPNPETELKRENIDFLRSLLHSIGIKLAKPTQKVINGIRERVYCVDDPAMQAPARLEVLSAIARKFDGYLQSEAVAKVNWEESPLDPVAEVAATAEIAAEITTVVETEITVTTQAIVAELPVENQQSTETIIEKLLKASNWGEVKLNQTEIDEVWPLLSQNQQTHLWQLHQEYQQQLSLEELVQEAIAKQIEVKETGFGSHFRSYVLKAVCDGVAIARRCWGLKEECEIPLSNLILTYG